MRVELLQPPREFGVGDVVIRHAANVELEPDEQITLTTASGTEFDVVRKSWGYYATPTLNRRLVAHGLRAALVATADDRVALLMVERGHEDDFDAYVAGQEMRVLVWLDGDDAARQLERP